MMYKKENLKKEGPKEEYAIVLDVVLDNQKSFKENELVQAIGLNNFTLLELVPKQGVILKNGDRVYIGDAKRDEIQYIKRSIFLDKLSASAKSEILFTLIDIVNEKEKDFVNFFNNAGPITIRKHSLELIPGIGKKHLSSLLELKNTYKFESFDDIKSKCPFLSEPQKAIAERILYEMEHKEDIHLFVKK